MRFAKIFGYSLLVLSLGCTYTLYVLSTIEGRPIWMNYFGIAVIGWYFLTGIAILSRQKWGYYLLKLFLYILFVAFPIGTFISYKSLAYIKTNNIRAIFI
jgi:hypothetical protein